MTREKLRSKLALAIRETLGSGHAWTLPNAKRYLTRDVLACYCIRYETELVAQDYMIALQLAKEYRARLREKKLEILRSRRVSPGQIKFYQLNPESLDQLELSALSH